MPIDGSEEQYSRVTGPRFEAGRTSRRGAIGSKFWAAVEPEMHGVQYTRVNGYDVAFTCFQQRRRHDAVSATAADGEIASQVDPSARIAHRIGQARGAALRPALPELRRALRRLG